MRNNLALIVCAMVFLITRAYIWVERPKEFTEIIYSYMPYAHLWADGVKPYLEQWYEYPPATIPLFYLPHQVDMKTMNLTWHINYLNAYRGILLITDVGLFLLIIVTLKRFKVKLSVTVVTLIYYCLATVKANHFIYDSTDLVFAASLAISVSMPYVFKNWGGHLLGWVGYFLATAFKLINAPLALIYSLFERKNIKYLLSEVLIAGLLVWSIPLLTYRSSLSVMLVYHSMRGLQVESVPAQIAATINRFTKTEEYKEIYKNYDITGPVSSKVKKIYDILFPIALLTYIAWGSLIASRAKVKEVPTLRIALTFGYLFCFMLFAKVLSTPFLIWQIPLLSLFPYKSHGQQLSFLIPSLLMIALSMTKIPNIELGFMTTHLVIGIVRSLLIAWLVWQSVRLVNKITYLGK